MKDITDADDVHNKSVCKGSEIRNFRHYHYLYVRRYTLLLSDVFEEFRNVYLKIYDLGHAQILSAPGLEWKAKVKLHLSTVIDILLIEKGIIICNGKRYHR